MEHTSGFHMAASAHLTTAFAALLALCAASNAQRPAGSVADFVERPGEQDLGDALGAEELRAAGGLGEVGVRAPTGGGERGEEQEVHGWSIKAPRSSPHSRRPGACGARSRSSGEDLALDGPKSQLLPIQFQATRAI